MPIGRILLLPLMQEYLVHNQFQQFAYQTQFELVDYSMMKYEHRAACKYGHVEMF